VLGCELRVCRQDVVLEVLDRLGRARLGILFRDLGGRGVGSWQKKKEVQRPISTAFMHSIGRGEKKKGKEEIPC
jgi:hypothetical protein